MIPRLCGPLEPWSNQTWKPDDIEPIESFSAGKIGYEGQTAADPRRSRWAERNNQMKMITYATLALGLMAALPVEANAVVCAHGAYHAGCAGPRGAVGVNWGYGYHGAAVVRPAYGARCYYRAGVRVCR